MAKDGGLYDPLRQRLVAELRVLRRGQGAWAVRARLRDCGTRGGSRSAANSSAIGRTGAAGWGPVMWSEWSVVGMRGVLS